MILKDIVIIGSGNLATNLAYALHNAGKNIVCIYSRKAVNAKTLADKIGTHYTDKIEELPKSANLYIIAVKDEAIEEIAAKMGDYKGIIVHTSGNTTMSVFNNSIKKFGVFYPVMNFSKDNIIKFTDVPICIEGNTFGCNIDLARLAKSISKNIHMVTSEDRKIIHLAAVFACNFSNLNYIIAEDVLQKNNLSFNLLKPLILHTANNIYSGSPAEFQTGPAMRKDHSVMKQQVELLDKMPEYKEMYEMLSKLIISIKHKK